MIYREYRCICCGACIQVCKNGAITWSGQGPIITDWQKCKGCRECISVCYAEAREEIGQEMTVAQVMIEIQKDNAFYDESGGGVTFSGGEPLAQWEFLLALLQACKQDHIHTAVDTSGYAEWYIIDRIRPYVDLFLYDLKVWDDAKHIQVAGVTNKSILHNLKMLSQLGHKILIRVPIIQGINDINEDICRIGEFAASLPHISGFELLSYHHMGISKYTRLNRAYDLSTTLPVPAEKMNKIVNTLRGFGLTVNLGG